jgi:hypothetical protein
MLLDTGVVVIEKYNAMINNAELTGTTDYLTL